MVCATSKVSDQHARTRSLIRVSASRLNIHWQFNYWPNSFEVSRPKRRLHRLVWVCTCQNATLLESHVMTHMFKCTYRLDFIMEANTMVPDQTAPFTISSLIRDHIVFNTGYLKSICRPEGKSWKLHGGWGVKMSTTIQGLIEDKLTVFAKCVSLFIILIIFIL